MDNSYKKQLFWFFHSMHIRNIKYITLITISIHLSSLNTLILSYFHRLQLLQILQKKKIKNLYCLNILEKNSNLILMVLLLTSQNLNFLYINQISPFNWKKNTLSISFFLWTYAILKYLFIFEYVLNYKITYSYNEIQ